MKFPRLLGGVGFFQIRLPSVVLYWPGGRFDAVCIRMEKHRFCFQDTAQAKVLEAKVPPASYSASAGPFDLQCLLLILIVDILPFPCDSAATV